VYGNGEGTQERRVGINGLERNLDPRPGGPATPRPSQVDLERAVAVRIRQVEPALGAIELDPLVLVGAGALGVGDDARHPAVREREHGGCRVLDADGVRSIRPDDLSGGANEGDAADKSNEVEEVDRVHQEDAAAGPFGTGSPVVADTPGRAGGPIARRLVDQRPDPDDPDRSDRAVRDHVAGNADGRRRAQLEQGPDRDAGRVGKAAEPIHVGGIESKRLLDQDVAPGGDRSLGDVREEVVGETDIDDVDPCIAKEIVELRVDGCSGRCRELRRQRLEAVVGRDEGEVGNRRDRQGDVPTGAATADDPDAERLHDREPIVVDGVRPSSSAS
jgi:hypothetical protein